MNELHAIIIQVSFLLMYTSMHYAHVCVCVYVCVCVCVCVVVILTKREEYPRTLIIGSIFRAERMQDRVVVQ